MNALLLIAGLCLTQGPRDAELLAGADERIARYRTMDAVLELVDAADKPIPAGQDVQIQQTQHKFLFGCNIFALGSFPTAEENAAYEKYFAELWNYATLPFYWWDYEPAKGQPRDARTEKYVAWCRAHHVACKGHPLAWNWVDPPWLPNDPNGAMLAQYERITRCIRRFPEIRYWDVVNEATHWDRQEAWQRAPMLTKAIQNMGVAAYIVGAFQAARHAENPDAVLIINDYDTTQLYIDRVLNRLVEGNKPLYDVIGIQCHQHGGAWPASKTWEICERFAAFNKPLHFTEATIVSGAARREAGTEWASTPEGEQRQARDVVRFYTVLFSHPAVQAITWWDFADARAWQGAPAGYLRKDMTPKPAYDALKGLIKGKWWTRADARAIGDGQVRFRGFLGEYQVTVPGSPPLTGQFRLDKSSSMPIKVRVQ